MRDALSRQTPARLRAAHPAWLALACLVALVPQAAVAQNIVSQNITDEICGDGIDNSASGHTKGSCPGGWADAVYSDGCDFLCPGIDKDQDGFYSEDSGLRTETATVNGAQTSVNTVTVDSGHSIREGMFIDVASPARRVTSWTATTVTFRGAAVTFTDNQVISAVDAIDCDDTNRDIIPGEAYACDAGGGATSGYRYCLSTGSYGSCTSKSVTPFCPESPGNNATCYYVSEATGNDSTGTGTHGNPWKSLGMLSGGSTGSEPAGAHTLTAGDAVVLLGDTNFTTSFTYGSDTTLLNTSAGGTADGPIIIERDPGAAGRLVNTNGDVIFFDGGSFVEFRNLQFSSSTGGSGNATGLHVLGGDSFTFIRVKGHDSAMNGDNNNNCIYCTGTTQCRVHNSLLWDCNRDIGNVQNVGGIMWLDNDASGDGSGHRVDSTVFGADSYSSASGPTCVRSKHGPNESDVGADLHPVIGNYFLNCAAAATWNGSSLWFRNNVVYGSGSVSIVDGADPGSLVENELVEYNTLVDMEGYAPISFVPTYDSLTESLTLRYNVIRDKHTSYAAGNNEGVYSINGYGSDTNYADFEANDMLTSNSNCFYNPNIAANFNYFGTNGGAWGSLGSNYSFTNWKALSEGYDAASFEKNPVFDSYLRATDASCEDFGKQFVTAGAGPTPTPTPSPSPTPTPVPVGTFNIGPTLRNQVRIR